ncbi:GMC family oxidoreductase [Rhodopseudomonas palustris]|uniref:GMC family oxidoreductase n=1 Tax=Rhodopseudomonas palustris TaxID=1076 RepID=A0A323UJD1_RHOPL|nr:GMC family oxidoreductase [Rhodopseudomonas palustris]PZA12815.1 GMC family oxidoreductase [Rhodopseudomonas palustris]
MHVENLAHFSAETHFEADLVIVGGGPAGLSVARELRRAPLRILIVESGLLEEAPEATELSTLESIGEPSAPQQIEKRIAFHGANSRSWAQDRQPYGVRCRALGGSTHAWAGKSAAFDGIDFEERAWVPQSGWPIERSCLDPFLERAADILNLGPNRYDDTLWTLLGISPPEPQLTAQGLRSFFWQFSRSRIDPLDIMRFGADFLRLDGDNVRILLNATATRIDLTQEGDAFRGVEIATTDGQRHTVHARAAVIAGGGIENARLLLASNMVHANGVGNQYDLVGRFLMDHAGARIARFGGPNANRIMRRFGFYGLRNRRGTSMYMHGLAITPEIQEREHLLNSAIYFMPEHAADDPWDAVKRLLTGKSKRQVKDIMRAVAGAGLLGKGAAMKLISSDRLPLAVKDFVVQAAIRYMPNVAADDFLSRGVPHKVTDVWIDAISEQRPDPDSRITLSETTDRLGLPLPRVNWRINADERRTIMRLGHIVESAFAQAQLPKPILEPWVVEGTYNDAVIIDMAHSMGTTRMSASARSGVVDEHCQVHGVRNLYVAGSSVFPTSGHANPTLMIVAFAVRLADRIRQTML